MENDKMQQAISSFLQDEFPLDKIEWTSHQKRDYQKEKNVLEKYFLHFNPITMTNADLADVFEESEIANSDSAHTYSETLIKFALYLAKEPANTTWASKCMLSFAPFFQPNTAAKKVSLFFRNVERFELYSCIGLNQTKIGLRLCFVIYDQDYGTETNRIVNNFLDFIKNNQSKTIEGRLSECQAAVTVLTHLLRGQCIQRLTPFSYGKLIQAKEEQHHESIKYLMKYAMRFLFYLVDTKYYDDGRLNYLEYYRKDYNRNGTRKEHLDILLSEKPYQYRVLNEEIDHNKGLLKFVFINADSEEVCNCIANALEIFKHNYNSTKEINNNFKETLEPYTVGTIDDFCFATFEAQIAFFRKAFYPREAFSYLVCIYNNIAQRYNPKLFSDRGINPEILTRLNLAKLLYDGYEIKSFDPFDGFPSADKAIVCLMKTDSNTTKTINTYDLEVIEHKEYRDLLKDYLWHGGNAFGTRLLNVEHAKSFFSFLENCEKGTVKSLFYKKHTGCRVFPDDGLAYTAYLRQSDLSEKTQKKYIDSAKYVLEFGLESEQYRWIDINATFRFTKTSYEINNAQPIPDAELEALCNSVNKMARENVTARLCECVFYLLITTELRISEILNLELECTENTLKRDSYVLVSKKKTSANEHVRTPISIYTYETIERIKRITKSSRQACSNYGIASKLFLIPAHKKETYRVLTDVLFINFLQKCCEDAGVQKYTAANLRDTHMTAAREYRIRKGLSDMDEAILTMHVSNKTTDMHYVKTDIVKLLEATNGIIIGNVPIIGRIEAEGPKESKNEVSNHCGYCNREKCNSFTYVDCLLCKDFVATRDKTQFFEMEIARIDRRLHEETIPHERESLQNIKRLLLGYLSRLLSLEVE